MSEIDFLDEIAEPTKIDEQVPDTTVTNLDESAPAPKYPNLLAEYASFDEISDEDKAKYGELQTVSDFTSAMTLRNITQLHQGAEGIVDKTNVYNATKAVRNPLPVVLVDDTVYLPWNLAEKAWDERPARGEGGTSATGGRLDDETLLKRASAARASVEDLIKRLAKVQERLNKAKTLQEKRERQMSERWGSEDVWSKVDQYEEEHPDGEEVPDAA